MLVIQLIFGVFLFARVHTHSSIRMYALFRHIFEFKSMKIHTRIYIKHLWLNGVYILGMEILFTEYHERNNLHMLLRILRHEKPSAVLHRDFC